MINDFFLKNVHAAGVLHGDIKVENILLDRSTKNVTLIDFGGGARRSDSVFTSMNGGTMENCTPEFLEFNRYHGVPAAIWTLGLMLFALACDTDPFENEEQIIRADVIFPEPDCSRLTDELKGIIRACLSRNYHDRPSLDQLLAHPFMKKQCDVMHQCRNKEKTSYYEVANQLVIKKAKLN